MRKRLPFVFLAISSFNFDARLYQKVAGNG